jgi:hypothetical protein
VIPNITRGRRVYGLLVYLWGPGRREEHVDPHLVAAWDGAGELANLEPVARGGRHDVRHLVDLLEIPVRSGRNPPRKPVWHCSVRAHPTDPILTDQQWRDIATDVLARVGLAPPGDEEAARWIAMRHGPDHIHIVATLVRQDRRTYWARNDYPLAQAACRDIEHRYNFVRLAPAGRGSRSYPKARELNKNHRQRRPVTPREELRRRVRDAATHAIDEQDFFTRLTADRTVTVRLRESERNPGEVTGYAVHLADDTTATGEPIFYSGATLRKDLSLTRLRQRWQPDTTLAGSDRRAHQLRPTPAEIYQRAAALITNATTHIRAHATSPNAVAGIAAATADLLTALARAWEGSGGGPLTQAVDLFDRAAHEPRRTPPAGTGRPGHPLRIIARLLSTSAARGREQRDLDAMLQLVRAIAGIADTIGDLRHAQQRLHQADAAYMAAVAIKAYQPPTLPPRETSRDQPQRTLSATMTTSPRPLRHGR